MNIIAVCVVGRPYCWWFAPFAVIFIEWMWCWQT